MITLAAVYARPLLRCRRYHAGRTWWCCAKKPHLHHALTTCLVNATDNVARLADAVHSAVLFVTDARVGAAPPPRAPAAALATPPRAPPAATAATSKNEGGAHRRLVGIDNGIIKRMVVMDDDSD